MKTLITGVCGFVGSSLAQAFRASQEIEVHGIDNFCRPGSEINRRMLHSFGVKVRHGDVRNSSDLDDLPSVDWVIDAAANPSVLAGISGTANSLQVVEHNLIGTVNLLEFCKRRTCGLVVLSTSRVYSSAQLFCLPLEVRGDGYMPSLSKATTRGVTEQGITEEFPAAPPLSVYGATKLASEILALEYGSAFNFLVHIDRCGVIAGAGQFGKVDQGIVSFWIHSYHGRRPLRYIGFGGTGYQCETVCIPMIWQDWF